VFFFESDDQCVGLLPGVFVTVGRVVTSSLRAMGDRVAGSVSVFFRRLQFGTARRTFTLRSAPTSHPPKRGASGSIVRQRYLCGCSAAAIAALTLIAASPATAQAPALGTAASFGVLAG